MENDVFVVIEHLQGQILDSSYMLIAAARQVASAIDGDVIGILLANQGKQLAQQVAADQVLYYSDPSFANPNPEAYLRVLDDLLQEKKPRLLLCGDTSIGSELASALSIAHDLPLISSCSLLQSREGAIYFACRFCGGKLIAEGEVPGPSAILGMIQGNYALEDGQAQSPPNVTTLDPPTLPPADLKIRVQEFLKPEVGDVDITKEPVLLAVGRGIQREDNIQLVEQLARGLNAALCASRPVVDQDWLPLSRLVGKSGKKVRPQFYLALGISGAPEHVEGIHGDGLTVAINTDPEAPIFEVARYGAEIDLVDLLPVLTERVQAAKDR